MTAALVVFIPVCFFAVLSVPVYTATGVVQVSNNGAANPLLELAGAGAADEVETEVEIMRRREFVLGVLKALKLHIADREQASFVTTDLDVAIRGASPVRERLRRIRSAAEVAFVAPNHFNNVEFTLIGQDDTHLVVELGPEDDLTRISLALGEILDDPRLTLKFTSMPVEPGESADVVVYCDGALAQIAARQLGVSSIGSSGQRAKGTNLVQVSYSDPDRETARAVVQGIMDRYLEQSVSWQSESASNAANFIAQRIKESQDQLAEREEALRQFAEREHAVQLETQAKVTIENAAEIETEKRQLELQASVVSGLLSDIKKRIQSGQTGPAGSGSFNSNANLTANFSEDPVLVAAIQALTEAETRHSMLGATLTEDHPQVRELGGAIRLQQKEVARMLSSTYKDLAARQRELSRALEEAMGSLTQYPDKELQLARYMREVEVGQRLNAFLLEKHQEAEIMKASTTTNKRIVDAASLPFRRSAPKRTQVILNGLAGGLTMAFGAVFLAHLLQRKLQTVEAVREAIPFPVYGTIPAIAHTKRLMKGQLAAGGIWEGNHSPGAEAFRALSVQVSLSPAPPKRARIVQVTSSQAGEGKSTVLANLATALVKNGARVLLCDLDLRKPVQHRAWSIPRSPGYSDFLALGKTDPSDFIRKDVEFGVDILPAGTRLPDTLGAVLGPQLEAMLADVSQRYDYVLLDSAPAFVADSTVIGQFTDLLLIVARPGAIDRGGVRHAIETIGHVEAAKGLVLNGVTRQHSDYYGGGYYYAASYGDPAGDEKSTRASA